MSPADFFTASGVLAWLFMLWRTVRLLRGLPGRIRWALFGARRIRSTPRFHG